MVFFLIMVLHVFLQLCLCFDDYFHSCLLPIFFVYCMSSWRSENISRIFNIFHQITFWHVWISYEYFQITTHMKVCFLQLWSMSIVSCFVDIVNITIFVSCHDCVCIVTYLYLMFTSYRIYTLCLHVNGIVYHLLIQNFKKSFKF